MDDPQSPAPIPDGPRETNRPCRQLSLQTYFEVVLQSCYFRMRFLPRQANSQHKPI